MSEPEDEVSPPAGLQPRVARVAGVLMVGLALVFLGLAVVTAPFGWQLRPAAVVLSLAVNLAVVLVAGWTAYLFLTGPISVGSFAMTGRIWCLAWVVYELIESLLLIRRGALADLVVGVGFRALPAAMVGGLVLKDYFDTTADDDDFDPEYAARIRALEEDVGSR